MLSVRCDLRNVLPIIGFSIAFWPLAQWYVRRLADGGDEPIGLFVLLMCVILIRRDGLKLAVRPYLSCLFLIIYAFSSPVLPPMLRCIPALLSVIFYYGWYTRPGIIALLTLSLPVVSSMQFYLGYPMRLASAEIASWVLSPFVECLVREGTNLSAYGKVVGVDPPCSGICMLWAGFVFGNVIVALSGMKWLKSISFNVITFVLIIVFNSIRAAILYAPESGVLDMPGWLHAGIGILCYVISAAILMKIGTSTWGPQTIKITPPCTLLSGS